MAPQSRKNLLTFIWGGGGGGGGSVGPQGTGGAGGGGGGGGAQVCVPKVQEGLDEGWGKEVTNVS